MSTIHTQRATVRPSRSRITRARVSGFVDRHDDALTLAVVATIVVLVSAVLALGLAVDYAVTVRDAVAVASIVLALSALSGAFAYLVGSERATRRVSRRYSRYLNEQRDNHERALERVTRDSIGTRSLNEMSAYEMSAELARLATRETHLRNALRVKVRA